MAVVDSTLSFKELMVLAYLYGFEKIIDSNSKRWYYHHNYTKSIDENLFYTQDLYKLAFNNQERPIPKNKLSEIQKLEIERQLEELSKQLNIFKSFLLSSYKLEYKNLQGNEKFYNPCMFFFPPYAGQYIYKTLTSKKMKNNWYEENYLKSWAEGREQFKNCPESLLFCKNGKPKTGKIILLPVAYGNFTENLNRFNHRLNNIQAYLEFNNTLVYAEWLKNLIVDLETCPIPNITENN